MKKLDKTEADIEIVKTNFLHHVNNKQPLLIFDNLESFDDLKNIFKLELIKAPFIIRTRLSISWVI